ncbi:resuscitation-promoting factor [Nonomuraea soli]|uniref:DUF348 domain-containing protein n=1 Tax=Nonomuraea soli TaxID=1032476 RepID=A0A7W0HTW1_9ACTN|nr:resuscitation-promoting factor [Nonomuraea soli]MBA2895524.1 hypothetical protein [Nonomuraea soli]
MAGSRRKPRPRCPWLSPWAWTAYGVAALIPVVVLSVANLGKQVELVIDQQTVAMSTFSDTVYDLLDEADVSVGPNDYVSSSGMDEVADGSRIVVRRARPVTLVVDSPPEAPPVASIGHLSASDGGTMPVSEPAERRVQVVEGDDRKIVYTTGNTVRQVLQEEGVRLGPGDRVTPSLDSYPPRGVVIKVEPARPARAVPAGVAELNWAALARCESHGNPKAVNAAGGYYGMYQFSLPMWKAVGGTRLPTAWPEAEQTYRAQLLYQRVSGRWQGQWPQCGAQLFS